MTPHSLRLSDFGAFDGTVSVDLGELASAGLFLLHGPTGGGKSTLLDAIGFALYGRVPGARNAAKRLRSDFASRWVPTEVCREARFGTRRIGVTRAPAYDR
ncbi:MAG: sbcC, partial [Frankiales bacterium]|nr:sbcC [Frankiales bacterium]